MRAAQKDENMLPVGMVTVVSAPVAPATMVASWAAKESPEEMISLTVVRGTPKRLGTAVVCWLAAIAAASKTPIPLDVSLACTIIVSLPGVCCVAAEPTVCFTRLLPPVPTKSVISCWAFGVPKPVTRSYPGPA